jgi:hypothetical protein
MTRVDLDATENTQLNRRLLEEAFPEHLRKIHDVHLSAIYERIAKTGGQTALCFSGGGIRSATFALGVIQGLARHGLLKHFDYLSTVSGGGYIGSWLSSWIHHANGPSPVFAQLATRRADSPTDPEPKQLRHLRMFSNYLTPKLGLFSADTWVLIGTYLRNLLLNWVVFLPMLLALLAVPRLHVSLLHLQPPGWVIASTFMAGFILSIWGLAYSAMNRPAVRDSFKQNGGDWFARRGAPDFLRWCLAPICLAAICLTTAWAWVQNGAISDHEGSFVKTLLGIVCGTVGLDAPGVLNYLVLGAVLHSAGWLLAERFLKRWRKVGPTVLLSEFGAVIASGAVAGFFLWAAATLSYKCVNEPPGLALYSCFAVPLFLMLFLIGATLFIGVSSNCTSDEDREWWARMGAWTLLMVVAWCFFSALVLFGPIGLLSLPKLLGTIGGLSGLFTLIVGHSGGSKATTNQKSDDSRLASLLDLGLNLAAPLSLAAMVAGLSLATSWLLVAAMEWLEPLLYHGVDFSLLDALSCFDQVIHDSPWWLTAGFVVGAALTGTFLSRFININKFSLHAIYRNRLVRAYLGASNPERSPNPFTGFDSNDNLPLQDLRVPQKSAHPQRPFHIINMALNLVGGEELAWQQRKAETFTASALHCGSFRLGYRNTKHYALNEKGLGLSIGTAVAISGAAASPNQGYHSSPMVALLMTLFNVRLGWWLGNPGAAGHATFRDSAPRSPVRHLIKEGLGLTDSTSPYVYVSDGGHFENLGLYEMILRRCRLIVLSDAGCDPKCNLEDLGNAIRKIRIDLGVKIDIKKFSIYSRTDEEGKKSGKYCAVADIDYGTVDDNPVKGTLIYFKPALRGDEPRDIYNYSRASQEFPHESTGDQWFSESQFESYRALGQHVIDRVYEDALRAAPTDSKLPNELSEFVARVYQYVENPPPLGWEEPARPASPTTVTPVMGK